MNATDLISAQSAFEWQVQPRAASLVATLVEQCRQGQPAIGQLESDLHAKTGTRLVDWLDHLVVPEGARIDGRDLADHAAEAGFVRREENGRTLWEHPRGLFPTLLAEPHAPWRLAMRVEAVGDFLTARGGSAAIVGQMQAALRMARIAEGRAELWIVERHGERGFAPPPISDDTRAAIDRHLAAFRARQRECPDAADGFAQAESLIRRAAAELGVDRTCDLFFQAERAFWQARNRAAGVQKARQDALGLGWANHDHHTYRSSRELFARLIAVLELLGFECRERFYGGHGAGWGAQVLEQPRSQVVIFADVDLSPEEVTGDFAHEGLAPRDSLGTVGLWCALHGEAFLEAGMHHLECRFDFDAARTQLASAGITTMQPFTDFEFLKQAFTAAEHWPVRPERIERLLASRRIRREEAEKFLRFGALGSHLEILERNDGYKGFNQTGISQIIRQTDPRK